MNKRGVNLISDALRFHRRRYLEVRHAIGYAEFYSRSHGAVIHAYDGGGKRRGLSGCPLAGIRAEERPTMLRGPQAVH
jgi:hypothetical protein